MDEPSVRQRLDEDLKTAMRAGDATTRDAIRYILAAVKNAEIDARGSGKEADPVATLRRVWASSSPDSIEQYEAAGRQDLADHEKAQLEVLAPTCPRSCRMRSWTRSWPRRSPRRGLRPEGHGAGDAGGDATGGRARRWPSRQRRREGRARLVSDGRPEPGRPSWRSRS